MTSLTFDTCCGCIELRTGCLIIGYLNLLYSIFMVIFTIVLALGAGVALSQADLSELHDKHPEITKGAATAAISVVAILILVIVLLFLIFNIVFVVGVHQNKRGHVKAYLIFSVIFLVLYTIMFLAGFAQRESFNWGNVFTTIFFILLSVYFLLVIRSFYYKMNDASRQPAIYNTGA